MISSELEWDAGSGYLPFLVGLLAEESSAGGLAVADQRGSAGTALTDPVRSAFIDGLPACSSSSLRSCCGWNGTPRVWPDLAQYPGVSGARLR